jgi:DNA-directed RNA polymerase specialized sigma24 family protein
MDDLTALVVRSQAGDLEAYGRLVERTQRMVQAVAFDVLRDMSLAEDAAQETYIRAFRRLGDVHDPAAFPGWLRRIAVTVALNARRARRRTWLCLDDASDCRCWTKPRCDGRNSNGFGSRARCSR